MNSRSDGAPMPVAVRSRPPSVVREFAPVVAVGAIALVLSSMLIYAAEHEAQPDHFGSILDAAWWSLTTLTTIGYGDATPVTGLGKVVGAATAVTGFGLLIFGVVLAMSAGIGLGLRTRHANCPHCGGSLAQRRRG